MAVKSDQPKKSCFQLAALLMFVASSARRLVQFKPQQHMQLVHPNPCNASHGCTATRQLLGHVSCLLSAVPSPKAAICVQCVCIIKSVAIMRMVDPPTSRIVRLASSLKWKRGGIEPMHPDTTHHTKHAHTPQAVFQSLRHSPRCCSLANWAPLAIMRRAEHLPNLGNMSMS